MSKLLPKLISILISSLFLVVTSNSSQAIAALEPIVEWSTLSLSPSSTYEVATLASTNSKGSKKWSVSGACTLKLGEVTTKRSGYCTVNLLLSSRGNFMRKSSSNRFQIKIESSQTSFPNSFALRTAANGLGSNEVNDVFVSGSTVYAATDKGLSISVDRGATFSNRTFANGLGDGKRIDVWGVYAIGPNVYAATGGGLSISVDGGTTFTNRTTAHGLGSNFVNDVLVVDTKIYAATYEGLSISVDGGATFTNKASTNGLGGIGGFENVEKVFVVGSNVYAAINGGLSISTDGGATFTNHTDKNGLGFCCNSVFVSGRTIYVGGVGGLFISRDSGKTFKQPYKKYSWNYVIMDLSVVGNTIYAATSSREESCPKCGGVSISTDGGVTFSTINFNISNGMVNTETASVYVVGSKIHAALRRDWSGNSPGGLMISD